MFWSTLLQALRSIRRNLLRSALTMLGIVIGVAAVITMVNLGRGATVQVTTQIKSLGSNLLMLRSGQRMGHGQRGEAPPLYISDSEAVAQEISSIAAVAPTSGRSMIAIFGNVSWSTNVTGADNYFFSVRNWTIKSGRIFSDNELRAGKAVCVLGATVVRELFGNQDPIGSQIRLKKIACTVVGVLASKGQSTMGSDQDDTIILPLRAFWRRIAGNQEVDMISISARDGASTTKVKRDIENLMRERRKITEKKADDFSVRDMQEIAKTLAGTTQVLTGLLGAVAAVSLFVGGIGIMNIMIVSVTERTREIGIRLAIGALEREVLLQFLVEAVVLSSLGGIVGIVVAVGASVALSSLMQVPFVFSTGIVVLSFFVSAAVGIFFGYFPARKAASLDPIEALRHE